MADIDRSDPEGTIARFAAEFSNWGRWGESDALGTINFVDDAMRAEAAKLITRGISLSLSQPFDEHGPQKGWRKRTNPVHTMLDTGLDAQHTDSGFPHGFGGSDDAIAMPLQCSTQWDGLGHIFDHGVAWNGRPAGEVVTSQGDLVTGIERMADRLAGRGVLLDVARHLRPEDGELPDGFAITEEHLISTALAHDVRIGRGDFLMVRTGRLSRAKREGWGDYAGGPSAGLSLGTAGWIHRTEIAAIATDTWGFEVRPNEFDVPAFQPFHQVAIPHIGLTIGEMWDLDELAAHCAHAGRYDFFLAAPPLSITGAVGSPVNPMAFI